MAYTLDDYDKQEQQSAIGQKLRPTQNLATGGGAPASMPTSSGAGSGRFVGFERYFNANRDAAAATGDKLAGGVESRGREASKGLASAEKSFNTRVADGAVTFFGDEGEEQAREKAGGYRGPSSLDEVNGFQQVAALGARAASEAQALGNDSGRQALLAQEFGATTQGGGALDSALTNATTGNRFQQLSSRYSGLRDSIEKARTQASTYADGVRTASGQAASEAGAYAGRLRDEREAEEARRKDEEAREAAARARAEREKEARELEGNRGLGGVRRGAKMKW